MVIQFPRVTLCFALIYFNSQFHFHYLFHMSSTFHLIYSTNCKFTVRKVWKLLMEVYQWINMIIMVIQFPRVTLCFPWKVFQHAISLSFSNFICPQLFILFIVQIANSKYESWLKLLMEVDQWIIKIIMVIQFPRVTLCFLQRYFNMQFHSYFQISYVLNLSTYLK